ncbi:LamG domain-containing protein [Intrasporangium mesophilum]
MAAFALGACLPGAVVKAEATSAAATPGAPAVLGADAAAEQARSSGVAVEVSAETSETEQRFANPDGSFTLKVASEPVRVRSGSTWVPVDTTLMQQPDGTWSPVAATSLMSFSGGGSSTPLVSFSRGGTTMAWSWPGTLPVPLVAGDTVTYPDVFTDVDLRLVAHADGFGEALVVKSARGAAQTQLEHIALGVHTTGGWLARTAQGGFEVRSDSGSLVMQGGSPLMWDASGALLGSGPNAPSVDGAGASTRLQQPVAGDHASGVALAVTSSAMTIAPNLALLRGDSTQYPVVIDPDTYRSSQSAHAMVDKSWPTTSYYNWSDTDQGVGYQDFSGVSTKRLLFKFSLAKIAGAKVKTATFSDVETYASTCTAEPLELWQIGSFGTAPTWNAQPSWTSRQDTRSYSYGRAGCPTSSNQSPNDTTAEFTATTAVANLATAKAGVGYFGLKAPSETNDLEWKRFKSAAILSVDYDFPPNTPTNLSGPGGCSSSTAPAVVPTTTVTVQASMTDPNPATSTLDQLTGTFAMYPASGSATTKSVGPHAQGTFQTSFTLAPGAYHWQAYSSDGRYTSPTAGTCYFTIDTSAPSAPAVTLDLGGTPTAPPADGSSVTVAAGTPLSFTFAPGAVNPNDTVKYRWSVNSDTPNAEWLPSSTATTGGISQSKSITLAASGPNLLRVWAYDKAGNQSGLTQFPLWTDGLNPARWSMDEATGPSAVDPTCIPTGVGPAASPMTWGTGVTAVPGHKNQAMPGDMAVEVGGTATVSTTGTSPVANGTSTTQSVGSTTTAWVHLDPSMIDRTDPNNLKLAAGGPRDILSMAGATTPAVAVQLKADPTTGEPRFSATVTGTGKTFTSVSVMDVTTPVNDSDWYELAVTVDPADRLIELVLVDDDGYTTPGAVVSQGTWAQQDLFTPQAVAGPLRLGVSALGTGWSGAMDEVRQFRGGFVSPNSATASTQLNQWLSAVPPFTTGTSSPCT